MNFLTHALTSAAIKSVSKAAYKYSVEEHMRQMEKIAANNRRIIEEVVDKADKDEPTVLDNPPIFISYCGKDNAEMLIIQDLLQENEFSCYAYNETNELQIKLQIAEKSWDLTWEQILELVIREASYIVVLITPNVKDDSWVRKELEYAEAHHVPIASILTKGVEPNEVFLSTIDANPTITDLSLSYKESDSQTKGKDLDKLKKFIQDIKDYLTAHFSNSAPSGVAQEENQKAKSLYISKDQKGKYTHETEIILNTNQSSFNNNKIALRKFIDSNRYFVFISYSSSDYVEMKEIYNLFWGNDISCIAQDNIGDSRDKWDTQLTEILIKKSIYVILIITPNSGRDSLFRQEMKLAVSNSIPVIPVLMKNADEKDLSLDIIGKSSIDLSFSKDEKLKKLVNVVRASSEPNQAERFSLTTEEKQIVKSFYLEPSSDINPWKKIKRGISLLFIDFVAFVVFLATMNSDSVPAWWQWLYLIVSVLIVPLYSIYLILLGVFRGVQKWYASGETKWWTLNDLFMSVFRPFL